MKWTMYYYLIITGSEGLFFICISPFVYNVYDRQLSDLVGIVRLQCSPAPQLTSWNPCRGPIVYCLSGGKKGCGGAVMACPTPWLTLFNTVHPTPFGDLRGPYLSSGVSMSSSGRTSFMSPVVSCMGLEPKSMDVIPSNIVIVYTEFRMGFY